MQPLRIVLATRNPGKVAEMVALLQGLPVELLHAGQVAGAPEVDEDAPTLEGNACKKALTLQAFTGLPALADDTGLEVAALDGAPGVYSARYAGPAAVDAANRARLLAARAGHADRTARFRTVLAYADGQAVHTFEGICTGTIGPSERGEKGFGYDALFVPSGETRTFAEMRAPEKNEISHRGRALRAFVAFLRDRIGA